MTKPVEEWIHEFLLKKVFNKKPEYLKWSYLSSTSKGYTGSSCKKFRKQEVRGEMPIEQISSWLYPKYVLASLILYKT